MELGIYWITLLVLLPTVVLLTGRDIFMRPFKHIHIRWKKFQHPGEKFGHEGIISTAAPMDGDMGSPPQSKAEEVAKFRVTFLSIYLLVMSSEWLSGPYLYPLLREDKGLPVSIVVALYATAYTSAAISALGVGFLADRYGRRKACLAECVIHALACLSVIVGRDCLPVLFLGRVLAGVGLTLLWTVFESWMVTEWNARGLEGGSGGGEMSRMFGMMTTANCMTAIVGGVLGHCMVSIFGSKLWPFAAGIILEIVAAVFMMKNWNENYGVKEEECDDITHPAPDITGPGRLGDCRLWALTFVTCCFEGTSFLVIFFWPSVLQDAHDQTNVGSEDIPYGVIFASFMASMILGSLLFSSLSGSGIFQGASTNPARSPACLLICALVVAGLGLFCLSIVKGEISRFYMFLVFEVANGVYVPSVAYIRGLVVEEKNRTGLYGLMKIPLFVFVILALGITAEDTHSRRFIFISASFCLLLAVGAMILGFRETLRAPQNTSYSPSKGILIPEIMSCTDSHQRSDDFVDEHAAAPRDVVWNDEAEEKLGFLSPIPQKL